MASNLPVILAIAPGTRECGIAVFEGFKLIYFRVKTSPSSLRKREKIPISKLLNDLFERFPVQTVVIKQINQYQQASSGLKTIVSQIKMRAESKHILVKEISLTQIKSLLSKEGKPTQKKTFKMVANLYPELQQFQDRPNKWQNDYYAYIFAATAVALVYLTNMTKKEK
jgi:Holliday junction resolvasome RuvABC endonuclease subunit